MVGWRYFEPLMQYALRPLALQLMALGFVLLIVWDLVAGMGLFSKINKEVSTHEAVTQHHAKTEDESTQRLTSTVSLFGEYVPNNLDAVGIRQSMLDLTVVGILLSLNEGDSQVILQKPNGQEHFFRVGDALPEGGVIKRITAEGVLVLHNGSLERLSMPKENIQFENPGKPMPLGNDD